MTSNTPPEASAEFSGDTCPTLRLKLCVVCVSGPRGRDYGLSPLQTSGGSLRPRPRLNLLLRERRETTAEDKHVDRLNGPLTC